MLTPNIYKTKEETTLKSDGLLKGATDFDSKTLTVTSVTSPTSQGGTVALDGKGDAFYTPAADFYGKDTFNFMVIDGDGGTATEQVTIDVGKLLVG